MRGQGMHNPCFLWHIGYQPRGCGIWVQRYPFCPLDLLIGRELGKRSRLRSDGGQKWTHGSTFQVGDNAGTIVLATKARLDCGGVGREMATNHHLDSLGMRPNRYQTASGMYPKHAPSVTDDPDYTIPKCTCVSVSKTSENCPSQSTHSESTSLHFTVSEAQSSPYHGEAHRDRRALLGGHWWQPLIDDRGRSVDRRTPPPPVCPELDSARFGEAMSRPMGGERRAGVAGLLPSGIVALALVLREVRPAGAEDRAACTT